VGLENLPKEGAVIIAANHLSNFDAFQLQVSLPRPIFFMGKEELFQKPVMDWLFRQLGSFPVRRGKRDQWAIRHALQVLEHQQVLGMFPEGSRRGRKGLRTAKTGVARLAKAASCPIIPIAIHGPQYMLSRFPHRTRIRITIGPAIVPEPKETQLNLTDRMMFTIAGMLPPEARGVYQHHPSGF
jgi:1-acyl-sn-glycerol-3-phosphate acyltransferase